MNHEDHKVLATKNTEITKFSLCFALLAGLLTMGGVALPTAQSRPETFAGIVADLVAANRILAAEGILDGLGHVSVR